MQARAKNISEDFLVIDAKISVKYAISLASRLKPEYLLVSRRKQDKYYRYVIHAETFLDAVKTIRPNPSTLLEDFLNLHEHGAEPSLEIAGDPLDDVETQVQIKKAHFVHPPDFLILDRNGQAVWLIDPQRSNPQALYHLRGIGYEFNPPEMRAPKRKTKIRYSDTRTQHKKEPHKYWKPPQHRREQYEREPAPWKPPQHRRQPAPTDFRYRKIPSPPMRPIPEGKGLHQRDQIVLERHPYAIFPKKMALEQTAPLEIIVKAVKPKWPVFPSFKLIAHKGEREVPVLIIIKPGSFELIGEYYNTILVPVEAVDSKSVVFTLRAKEEGWQTVKVEFFQQGTYLGELEVKTFVVKTKLEAGTLQPKANKARWNLEEVPPDADLTLIIYERKTESEFEYEICLRSTKLGIYFDKTGPIRFTGNPEGKFRAIFQDIERRNLPPKVIEESVKAKGHTLYEQLFPDDFKTRYWKIRDMINSVQLISDEPWIPWEIIKPWRKFDGKIEEDNFLCERYAFSRWLEGIDFTRKKRLRKAKLVVPKDTNLPNVLLEKDWIQKFANNAGLRVTTDSRLDEVLSSLRKGGFDLLHFSTHGLFDPTYPYLSGITLEQGIKLRPEHISGLATVFGKANPLVILNACQTGAQGFALTGIGSWATQFLKAGASGFVGTLWSVSDDTAFRFTQNLYQKLFEGETLGEAVRQARNLSKRAGDPSWLAYELYGQPNSHVKLGRKKHISYPDPTSLQLDG